MADNLIHLEPDHFYHIYNHAVGSELFFKDQHDYNFFLKKLKKYAVPFFDIYGYSLMPNHFHLILRSHESKNIIKTLEEYYDQEQGLYHSIKEKENKENIVLYQSLSNFFNSYAKHYNKVHERRGTLFTRAFRRKLVTSDTYLQDLIRYLHQNPVKAKLCSQASEWKFSSYNTIIGTEATFVEREEIINLFFDLENFIACNNKPLTDLDSTF